MSATPTLPGTCLVPVFSRRGGGVPGTAAFGYGRIASASAFEADLGVIPGPQCLDFRGATAAPVLTLHASERLRERAPWLTALPFEGWNLWQHWTPPVGPGRQLATLEATGPDGAQILIVCPVADGAATTLYIAPAYEGSRCWSRDLPVTWERWAQGRAVRYGSFLAPATPEERDMVRALQSPRNRGLPAYGTPDLAAPSHGFTEEERALGM